MALVSLLLALLLAGAVDFGRAFFTSIVVTNMAGEGAAYGALFPDQDQVDNSCSTFTPIAIYKTIQERARRVAKERGLAIEKNDQNLAQIVVSTEGYGTSCRVRCSRRTLTVRVTYTVDDLFLPGMLGMRSITISRSASQEISRDPDRNADCSGG